MPFITCASFVVQGDVVGDILVGYNAVWSRLALSLSLCFSLSVSFILSLSPFFCAFLFLSFSPLHPLTGVQFTSPDTLLSCGKDRCADMSTHARSYVLLPLWLRVFFFDVFLSQYSPAAANA